MKLFLAILSISLAYCSDGDFLDQYIAANHHAELNRQDISPDFLYGQLDEVKVLVETAQTKRIAAENWDMAESLALAGNAAAKATVLARHDNKQFQS